jgi:hypothetical protein
MGRDELQSSEIPQPVVGGELARGPFGDPDGARADPADLTRDFVHIGGIKGIATREDDLNARVIVGRKGAGKTLYLRRSRAYVSKREELYADDLQQTLPSTADIVKVANWYSAAILGEKWMAQTRSFTTRLCIG